MLIRILATDESPLSLSKVGKPLSLFPSHSGEMQTRSAEASDLTSSRAVAAASQGSVTRAAVTGSDYGFASEVSAGSRTCWPAPPAQNAPFEKPNRGRRSHKAMYLHLTPGTSLDFVNQCPHNKNK